jgi:hypothetical protein
MTISHVCGIRLEMTRIGWTRCVGRLNGKRSSITRVGVGSSRFGILGENR